MSLPQSLSRSLILDAPGNLFLIHKLMFQPLLPFLRMNRRSRIRHPVWFIWRREISVDSASFRERTLTMPRRERWVQGRGVGVRGRGVCLLGAHSFHSLQKLWKCPLHTPGVSAGLWRYVSGDRMPARHSIVGSGMCNVIQRCWADKSTTCKLVSYSDSWPR